MKKAGRDVKKLRKKKKKKGWGSKLERREKNIQATHINMMKKTKKEDKGKGIIAKTRE